MKLDSLTMFTDIDEYAAAYINTDEVSHITTMRGPGDYADVYSKLHFKNGQDLCVRETPKELMLLFVGTKPAENKAKRLISRRTSSVEARAEAWKHFERAHYELSSGTQGHITKQQVTTPCTAQSTVHLFVGDGPIFRVYGDFCYDKHDVNHNCIACYSEKEQQLFVFESDEILKFPANADGVRLVDPEKLCYTDLLYEGHADDILGCCDGGASRKYGCNPHVDTLEDEEDIDPFA